jgi:hypothetical protein
MSELVLACFKTCEERSPKVMTEKKKNSNLDKPIKDGTRFVNHLNVKPLYG